MSRSKAISVRISPNADRALRRAAKRMEATAREISGDRRLEYGPSTLARHVFEEFAREEIERYGPLDAVDPAGGTAPSPRGVAL